MADIEYFYSAHSAFAFLGSVRLSAIARAADASIVHKPYDLHTAMDRAWIRQLCKSPAGS